MVDNLHRRAWWWSWLITPCLLLLGPGTAFGLPGVIPYQGVLTLNSELMSGDVELRFTVEVDGAAVWVEEWSTLESRSCALACPVALYNGRFSVGLGTHMAGLAPLAEAGESLLISIELLNATGDWVSLGGAQQLAPLPYSHWAAAANDMAADNFTVSRNVTTTTLTTDSVTAGGGLYAEVELDVAHELHSNDTINVTNATATVDINAQGAVFLKGNDILFDSGTNGDGGSFLQRDSETNTLIINSGGAFAGGSEFSGLSVETATIWGDLEVSYMTLEGTSSSVNRVILTRYPFTALSVSIGSGGGTVTTGMSSNTWDCWVGSFDFDGGSIAAGANQHIVRAYTYISNSVWHVNGNFASDSNETAKVGVVCVQDNMMDSTGSWF